MAAKGTTGATLQKWTEEEKMKVIFSCFPYHLIQWDQVYIPVGRTPKAVRHMLDNERKKSEGLTSTTTSNGEDPKTPTSKRKRAPAKSKSKKEHDDDEDDMDTPTKKTRGTRPQTTKKEVAKKEEEVDSDDEEGGVEVKNEDGSEEEGEIV